MNGEGTCTQNHFGQIIFTELHSSARHNRIQANFLSVNCLSFKNLLGSKTTCNYLFFIQTVVCISFRHRVIKQSKYTYVEVLHLFFFFFFSFWVLSVFCNIQSSLSPGRSTRKVYLLHRFSPLLNFFCPNFWDKKAC